VRLPNNLETFKGKYRELVDHVHEEGSKIAIQIAHCGRQTFDFVVGTQPIAPSAFLDTSTGVLPREMTDDDIERTIEDFAQGARRVKEAGFDAVQIHCAHGYLLSSFISPYTNRRKDQWGGTTENRVRIVGEIYKRCRAPISDPVLPRKMQEGKLEPARCIQCNLCGDYCSTRPLHCYHGKTLKDEAPLRIGR